jgi:DNA topoisomerase I
MKKLVIVESPSKSKTIEKYLGSDYKVVSSKGHIRDLATTGKYGLGVDLEDSFKPNYVAIKGKGKIIKELKGDVKDASQVYLASDPDREGEAISWHLEDALGLKDNYERVEFHEITKPAVLEAFNHPRKIDMNLVKSQETRRILDRIIGFRLSKLMQSKTGGKSAGRVQSVALKLIVDREREIEKFIPEEYWSITAQMTDFAADLFQYRGKDIKVTSESEANDILAKLSKSFKLDSTTSTPKKRASKPVFKTSTLQQTAANKLGFPASKTMKIAQKLYEGVDLGTETVGLITYMRTDSVRLSPIFINDTFKYIENKYGKDYVGYVKKIKKDDNVQDAHEGIRPTSITRTPESIKAYLTADEYKLYRLIYYKALSSLMSDAKVLQTTIILENNGYSFKATGSVVTFDGYLHVYSDYEDTEDKVLPDLSNYQSNIIIADDITKEQHFTKPLPRYTESSLIKELESLGIGRPSTYATIIDTLKTRNYVKLEEHKFFPTEIGITTTDKLQEFFSDIVNVKYTANMESDLDEIADNNKDNIKVLQEFWDKFEPLVQEAFKNMEKEAPKTTGEKCPECGGDLVIRKGKYGEFIACSNYPTCKYIKKEERKIIEIMDCPKCDGKIIEKKTRRGKVFYGCSNYPKCNFATWDKPTGEACPKCGAPLVEKGKKIKCSSCDYEKE